MNILVCTLGGSWAVVPEVYGFLAPDRLPLYSDHPHREQMKQVRERWQLSSPDEIWVGSTLGEQAKHAVKQLCTWQRLLGPTPVIRIWLAEDTDQLATQQECQHVREMLLRICLLAHERTDGGQVVLSLAGGRKTMSADLQSAGHLMGCHGLVHVVGKDPLPDELRKPTPEMFTRPLSAEQSRYLMPLVMGRSRRSELWDVDVDQQGSVCAARFPLPIPDANASRKWPRPTSHWLNGELNKREHAGSQLLGNYLTSLTKREHHENWRSLYRLPPRVIELLRKTKVGPELSRWLRGLPKADLHRHLGGCLNIADQRIVGREIWDNLSHAERATAHEQVRSLLDINQWPLNWPEKLGTGRQRAECAAALLVEADTDQLEHNLYGITEPRLALRKNHALGFAAYERPGELSGSALLTHPAAIEPYARQVLRQARQEGLSYVELRGSPQKYGDGLAFLRAFHDGLIRAMDGEPHPVTFRFIIIVDRRQYDSVRRVVEMAVQAKNELDDFVAGLDVAGDEGVGQPKAIASSFLPAFEICLPVTIHAGEGEHADSIWQAAYHLHADRIGHGLSIGEQPHLAERFRDRSIALELCPTSNREVVGYHDPDVPESHVYSQYPLKDLWDAGLPLTICTDNPGISRTTLVDEYLTASRMQPGGLNCWDMLAMLKQAFVHAFLPSQKNEELLKEADASVYAKVFSQFDTQS